MLQQVSEIATSQVQTIQTQQESRDKELTSLRQQLVDFQAQSNEKTVIGEFCFMAQVLLANQYVMLVHEHSAI